MNIRRMIVPGLLLVLVAVLAAPSFAALPARGSSNNGTDNGAAFWNLFGPTATLPRAGGAVLLRTQVVCANQDVVAAQDNTDFTNAGSCASGNYIFLFQIESTSKNITAVISNLVGFTPVVADPVSTYGIETCDSAQNTLELCSNVAAASPTAQTQLSKIKATVSANKAKITFTIPKVPVFPLGSARQGTGLTLVVVTQQAPGLPVDLPKITFK